MTQRTPGVVSLATPLPGLAGRVAVVTGAAQGIGAAFAEALVANEVRVVGADLATDQMKATAVRIQQNLGQEVLTEYVDVRDPGSQDELASKALKTFGQLDFWVNNAGVFPGSDIPDVPSSQFRDAFEVNVEGVMHGSQAAARAMAAGGSIVNMASMAAFRVRRGHSAYCASKAAVAHLTRCLAVELGEYGVRVNALAPGVIETTMTRWVRESAEKLEEICSNVPLRRLGSIHDLVGPLLFLLSDLGRYVTGHVLTVDGGMSLA